MCKIKYMQSASWAIQKYSSLRSQRKREKQCWTEQSKSYNGFDGHRWTVLVFLSCSEKVCFFPQNIKSRDLQPEAELVKPDSSALLYCARQSLMLQTSRPLHCCSPSAFTVYKPNQKHQAVIRWYMIHHFQVQKALSGKLWAHYDLRVFPLKF